MAARLPSKIQPVPFAQIVIPPALVTQREFRPAHADRIAAEFDMNKFGYPVVNHRDAKWHMMDGQHRKAAIEKAFPWIVTGTIECEVYENLTDAQMADIFLGRDQRKQIPQYDKFHVSCTAGYKRELDVLRAIESNGQHPSRTRGEGISALGAFCKVYDRSGDVVVGQVVRTINRGFGGDGDAFDRSIVEGLGLVYNRFNGKTNEKQLGDRLGHLKHGARELLRKAEAIRERTGNQKKHCVAAAIVDIYNKGEGPHSKTRLPSWWKDGMGNEKVREGADV